MDPPGTNNVQNESDSMLQSSITTHDSSEKCLSESYSDTDPDYIPENSCYDDSEFISYKRKRVDSSFRNEPDETKLIEYQADLQKCKNDISYIEIRLNTYIDENILVKDKNNYIKRLRKQKNKLHFYVNCYKLLSILEFIAFFIVVYERYTGIKITKHIVNMLQADEIPIRSIFM